MQISTQDSDTATDAALNFAWPAKLILKETDILLCCSSEPPIKADLQGVTAPTDGVSAGTCSFKVPASQLPGLGELMVQFTISPVALQLTFFQGANLIGVYAGSGGGAASSVGGAQCKFEFGTC
jgi:hypothetical protein